MDYEQIEKLIDKVNKSKITELSVEEGNFKLNIKAEQSVRSEEHTSELQSH